MEIKKVDYWLLLLITVAFIFTLTLTIAEKWVSPKPGEDALVWSGSTDGSQAGGGDEEGDEGAVDGQAKRSAVGAEGKIPRKLELVDYQ